MTNHPKPANKQNQMQSLYKLIVTHTGIRFRTFLGRCTFFGMD